MGAGCLITVRTRSLHGKDPLVGGECVTVDYLVAEQDMDRAVRIIERNIAKTADQVVAASRVSEELLDVLGVRPGGFMRADGWTFERHIRDADNGSEGPAFGGLTRGPDLRLAFKLRHGLCLRVVAACSCASVAEKFSG